MRQKITRETGIDMAAVVRVASRVNLEDISVVEVKARREPSADTGALEPDVSHQHLALEWADGRIRVASLYSFNVVRGGVRVAEASITYHLLYECSGDEPVDDEDVKHFAKANGAYNSWPFARDFIHNLTSRMGFPAYVLPVFAFVPPKPNPPKAPEPPDQTVVE